MTLEARLLATLLEQDSFFTDYAIRMDFEKAFGAVADDEEFGKALSSLKANDTLIGFDVEFDGLDGILFEHSEHGQIDSSELTPIGAETYFALGPAFPVALQENLYSVAEAAADGGFSEALRLLKLLPIDSSKWTGEARALRFTPEVQSKLVAILERARGELSAYELSNVDAAKVSAYVESALLLADLPDPEPDLVRLLVQRILLIIGFVGFAADLKGLLWTE